MIFVTLFFELIELGLYFFNNSSILSAKLLSEVCKTTEKPLGRGPVQVIPVRTELKVV